jgi:preprotein translocase subunit YajC
MIPRAMNTLFSLLQAAPGGAPSGPTSLLQSPLLVMVFIFAIFYFLVLGPMRKKQKETQSMLAKLKKGDEVITGGGIFGRISALDEERGFVVLQIADNVKVKVTRTSIVGLAPAPGEAAAATPAKT